MSLFRFSLISCFLAAACSAGTSEEDAPTTFAAPEVNAPSGTYSLEASHAFLYATVSHLGFSNYVVRFTSFDATLEFLPQAPESMSVTATIDVNSLETDYPFPEREDFNATLTGPQWLDGTTHPQMTFRSENIKRTGPGTADVTGPFTLRGITRPVTLKVTFNGGYPGYMPYEPNARIGFSARGSLLRSDYGISYALPTEDNPIGVGDEVTFYIEAEFTGPPLEE